MKEALEPKKLFTAFGWVVYPNFIVVDTEAKELEDLIKLEPKIMKLPTSQSLKKQMIQRIKLLNNSINDYNYFKVIMEFEYFDIKTLTSVLPNDIDESIELTEVINGQTFKYTISLKEVQIKDTKPLKVAIESAKGEDFSSPITPELIKEFQENLFNEFCKEFSSRIGHLSGVTSESFGSLEGYGVDFNGYIEGNVHENDIKYIKVSKEHDAYDRLRQTIREAQDLRDEQTIVDFLKDYGFHCDKKSIERWLKRRNNRNKLYTNG